MEQAIPVQYGRVFSYPDFAAQPYTEFAGGEQYLFQLLCLGCGEFEIEDIRLEDSSLDAFTEIEYEIVEPFGQVTLFPTQVVTSVEVSSQSFDTWKGLDWSQSGTTVTVTEIGHNRAIGQAVHFADTYQEIIGQLGATGLAAPGACPTGSAGNRCGEWARVIVEKPFGKDLASAKALNQSLLSVLKEEQVYRIDHYLGKETVQNILVFRFGNGIFEPVWNRRYIDHVQITAGESVGVEGRGGYYDQSGALRDMVQNHILQLLALVAMEPPSSMDANAVRDERVKVFRALRPIGGSQSESFT
ncbi:MAG: hypothetical protein GW802_39135, partial [Armatimonadetes bacterium]|nr:hypothetical protein [Armatimonadota bacterium]